MRSSCRKNEKRAGSDPTVNPLASFVYHLSVNFTLTPTESRVLGALIEKEMTTPEYYPLSLNALLNACNQKSNREPVMTLAESDIREALHSLDQHGLARSAATDGRVPKYEHRLQEVFNFHRHEIALLCLLLLRGPQTPGELRSRTDRLYQFDDLNSVHFALNLLMRREPPIVEVLPRQPGTKEVRYAHLLSGHPRADESTNEAPMSSHQPTARDLIGDIAPKLAELTDDVLFADVWERPGLAKRDRSLITVACLVALNRTQQLPYHLQRALDNGITKDELVELMTHLAFYAGWPTAVSALLVAKDLFHERS